ncbi:MAG: TM2 domain-containing protein [Clostridia bacterium]|nr:TM2 domain-containing protein [Clostridia bacterium]
MQNNYNAYPTAPQPPVYNAAQQGAEPPAGYKQRSRLAAGILGMLAGTLGLHNFYLGNNQRGLTQLLLSTLGAAITCGISTMVVMIWGLSEGIKILEHKTNTDGFGYALKD